MNRINPSKLKNSKWSAVEPKNKEKHFVVTRVLYSDEDGSVTLCELEAVMTKRVERIDWQQLKNSHHWNMGWR